MVVNVLEAEPNKNWKLKSCKGLELTYKTAKKTETDVQNFLTWVAIFASLFAQANDWELAFRIWKSSSLRQPRRDVNRKQLTPSKCYCAWLRRRWRSHGRGPDFIFVLLTSCQQRQQNYGYFWAKKVRYVPTTIHKDTWNCLFIYFGTLRQRYLILRKVFIWLRIFEYESKTCTSKTMTLL